MSRDDPDMAERAAAFYVSIDRHIAKAGRSIIGVFGEDGSPPFSYTIGNHLAGKPEFVILGLDPREAGGVLNLISELPDIASVQDGQLVSIGGAHPLKALACAERVRTEFAIQATRYLRTTDYRLFQLLVPDPQGRFPGDPECAEPYASTLVLQWGGTLQ